MTKNELLSRLKAQISLMKESHLERSSDVLCNRQDVLNITKADNMFRAAERLYADKEINALLGFPERDFIILPDDDGLRVHKGIGKTNKKQHE